MGICGQRIQHHYQEDNAYTIKESEVPVLGTVPSFTYTSLNTNQMVPPTGSVDGGTLLLVKDPAKNINGYTFPCAYGRSVLSLQLQAVFSTTTTNRPTWIQVELARVKRNAERTIISVDTTSPMRRCIVQPGTTTYSDTFNVPEFVNEDDGEFGWTVTHNGKTDIKITANIFKDDNPNADIIYALHGFNMWSDGTVH